MLRTLGCLTACLGLVASGWAAGERPHIVIFLVDDMGIMDTSVPFLTDDRGQPKRYPLNDYYRTPAMELLAERGVRFNQFYAMSVCSPTRVSIATGQNAARHRTTNWINPSINNRGPLGPPEWNWQGLKPDDVTLAGLLRSGGYQTVHIGKGHFGPQEFPGSDPSNLGFGYNIGGASFGSPGSYYAENHFGAIGDRTRFAVPHLEKYHGGITFLTEALTIEANALLTRLVKSDEPIFLYFSHYAVHAPFESDRRFAAHYQDSDKPAAAQAFATLIEGMDKSLGDLLDQLEALGIAEETLVFFLGDNGSDAPLGHQHEVACAAPLRGKKGAHYEGGMRVPFIAAWAKPNAAHPLQQRWPIAVGQVQSQLASVCDLFPTLVEIAGIQPPEGHVVDGHRLQTLLRGVRDESRPETFLMHYPHAPHRSDYWTSLREGPWKVIYHYHPSEVSDNSHYQLFQLENNPFEQSNLATAEPVMLGRMMNRLIASLLEMEAVYPLDGPGGRPLVPVLP